MATKKNRAQRRKGMKPRVHTTTHGNISVTRMRLTEPQREQLNTRLTPEQLDMMWGHKPRQGARRYPVPLGAFCFAVLVILLTYFSLTDVRGCASFH